MDQRQSNPTDVVSRSRDGQAGLRSQILDCIGHSVAVVDLEGRILFWNKFSETLYGWTEAEACGRTLLELVVPEESIAEVRAAIGHRQHAKPWSSEFVVRRHDGTTFCALIANTPLFDAEGSVIGRVAAVTDISARKEAEELLRENQLQLRALANRIVTAREAEATRIAREIHDQMGQALTAVKLDIAALDLDVAREGVDTATVRTRIAAMSAAINAVLETASHLCTELRPAVLDQLGLLPALEWSARNFEARSGIFCNLDLPAEPLTVDPVRATVMFRVLQEILTNILRHAEASEVTIKLAADDLALRLEVCDNGRGLGPNRSAAELGLGIVGMRERALSVGGRIEFPETPAGGTTVMVEIPR